ncbi:MAG: hypothetical protein IJV16_03665 [Lachnospiraceae bacterium]|nr:hypothetical protein [Lachnospiraceae bacterium]
MKEGRVYEIRVFSHIVLVVSVTVFSLLLIGINLYEGWDNWTIPLFLAAPLFCLGLHITNALDEKIRLYIYGVIILIEIFYYIMHADTIYDATPILMLTFALFAMTQERRLIRDCIVVGFLGIAVRLIAGYDAEGANVTALDVLKGIWNCLLVLATGLAVMKMLKTSEESRGLFRERIGALKQETKRADVFLANVSNEIKAPVDEIISLAEASLETSRDEAAADNMRSISYEGRKVAHQIGDMLDYSQLEMGKTVIEKSEYSISDILDSMVSELKIYKGIATELVIDVDPNIPRVMLSDPDKLKKILFHIIFNALKFTEKGGVYVRISYTPQDYGLNLNVDVTDTGIGMNEEEQRRIYDRFYKSEAGKVSDESGLGLGMSIVSGFIAGLEGFITVESKPGKGTKVHVSIPQEIADASGCMSLDNAESLDIGLYLQFDKFSDPHVREFYNTMMKNMAEGLKLRVYRVDNVEDLDSLVRSRRITHVFIGEVQYESDPSYMEELAERLKLVVVCDDDYEVPPHSAAIPLRKPFYCFPVMSILNGGAVNISERRFDEKDVKDIDDDKVKEPGHEGFDILKDAGIDPYKGMDWCLNDIEVYTAVLQEFASDAVEKQIELESFYNSEDWENFMIRVHAIKSSSNTIGAVSLSKAAKRLEKAAQDEDADYIKSNYPRFMPEYIRIVDAINSAYGAAADGDAEDEAHEG